jgi:hypothetical protein
MSSNSNDQKSPPLLLRPFPRVLGESGYLTRSPRQGEPRHGEAKCLLSSLDVTITATADEIGGERGEPSYSPSAQRYSIVILRPSTKPVFTAVVTRVTGSVLRRFGNE